MIISILSLFPEVFKSNLNYSILGRASKNDRIEFRLVNIRDYAIDKHKSVDDRPYGGGAGMLMRVDVVEKAIAKVKSQNQRPKTKSRIVLLDPAGKVFNQAKARQYSKLDHLILVCGHYEGIDARIHHFIDERISIGRYILTGGETAALVILESVTRLIPGVLKKEEAIIHESFTKKNIPECFQYTRPPEYKGYKVPKILFSGNHEAIKKWRESLVE